MKDFDIKTNDGSKVHFRLREGETFRYLAITENDTKYSVVDLYEMYDLTSSISSRARDLLGFIEAIEVNSNGYPLSNKPCIRRRSYTDLAEALHEDSKTK